MAAAQQTKCKCGCGQVVARGQWLPGHDHRAVHHRIKRDHGNVAAFIDWYDGARPKVVSRKGTRAQAGGRAA